MEQRKVQRDKLEAFERGLEALGIALDDVQIGQFLQYYELLTEWNSFMNLTAITEFEEVVVKHFLDSLSLVKAVRLKGQSVIDIGTGAGFPGIPLKIAFPELSVTLLDSLNKRVKFLNHVIGALQLKNITAVHGRAEELARQSTYREQYTLCVSRAVANLASLAEYCLPYVKQGGQFISYKSGHVDGEAEEAQKAFRVLGGGAPEILRFALSETEEIQIERSFVIVKKMRSTPGKYPRRAGLPTKEPIR